MKILSAATKIWCSQIKKKKKQNPTTSHSSILAWEIPWTEEPGALQSTESQRVRHEHARTYSGKSQKPLEDQN